MHKEKIIINKIIILFLLIIIPLKTVSAYSDLKNKKIIEVVPPHYLYLDTDKKRTVRNKEYKSFIKLMYNFAKSKNHPFPEAVAVQAGYESRYGASELARNANNTFGVKVYKNKNGEPLNQSYRIRTKEEKRDGTEYYIYDDFRYYKNLEENWKGYEKVINRSRYIKQGIKKAKNNKDYITALKKGGYATEDSYIHHILKNIKKFKEEGLFL
ncbi:glucosaminidase domain-containing protein [Hyphomicrobiales bacterium]|nr:glucosaminidase domain-containing protein [Hyphomicrobiales bacterium]